VEGDPGESSPTPFYRTLDCAARNEGDASRPAVVHPVPEQEEAARLELSEEWWSRSRQRELEIATVRKTKQVDRAARAVGGKIAVDVEQRRRLAPSFVSERDPVLAPVDVL
jgi:hypothetical protein